MAEMLNTARGMQSRPAKADYLPPEGKFMEKLLAPLPEGEEQADTKEFRRELWKDRRNPFKRNWRRAQLQYWIAENSRRIAGLRCALSREFGEGDIGILKMEERRLLGEMKASVDALMLCPAPDIAGLRWKQKHRDLCGGRDERDERDAAIAADADRLGVKA